MKIFYRISDNSYVKPKLPGIDKKFCLNNFLSIFPKKDATIIADNCSEETLNWLKNLDLDVVISNFGNAGALSNALMLGCILSSGDELIYQVEDDYLHKPEAYQKLIEADEANIADYYTLYDHPDKYTRDYGFGETSQVRMVQWQHWRYTISTTMTFACRAKTLIQDYQIWMYYLRNESHPPDHSIFTELNTKGRKLAVAIPGLACHTDLTYGLQNGKIMIEPWALRIAAQHERD